MKNKISRNVLIMALVFLFSLSTGALAFPTLYGGCTATDRTLYLKDPLMTGDDVMELQERLEELGYFHETANGVFGEKTSEAVKKIQADNKMPPTGEVGPATWNLLAADIKAPAVTSEVQGEKEPEGKLSIVVDANKMTLTLLENGEPFKTFPCAVGKRSTPSPIGEWKIINKGVKWGGGFGDRWMGLNVPWGIYGIHGTNKPYSIGTAASHGCIRMFNEHVMELYPYVKVGTAVKIVGDPAMPPGAKYRKSMHIDATGPDVVQIQLALKERGFLLGTADGRFGNATELAVKFFQVRTGQEDTGVIEQETYETLGIDTGS